MNEIKDILEKVYNNKNLRKSIVPLFIGNPGMGKTAIIEQFAKEKNVKLVEMITSQMSPFEISGICIPHHESGQMKYYNLDRIENLQDGDILFFDELLNGNPTVLNACLTLIEQRIMISGKKLPDIMIIAAANPQGMSVITPQIKERFVWYKVDFKRELFNNYMKNNYGTTNSINLQLCSLIEKESFTGNNFITPRSIEKALNMLIFNVDTPYKNILKPIFEQLIDNPFKETVTLPNGVELEKDEKITWLKLLQIKNNVL